MYEPTVGRSLQDGTTTMMDSDTQAHRMAASGGCVCGSVRYRVNGEVQFAGFCYCRDCQRVSGTGRTPFIGLLTKAIQIDGDVSIFTSVGGSGQAIERGFCRLCGGRVFARPAAEQGMTIIYAGTLDAPNRFRPEIGIHLAQRATWEREAKQLDLFDRDIPEDAPEKLAPETGERSEPGGN